MRGTKGGFYDRLIERIKLFMKKRKLEKQLLQKQANEKNKKYEKLKKEEQIIINANLVHKDEEYDKKYRVTKIVPIDRKFKNRIIYESKISKKPDTKDNKIIIKKNKTISISSIKNKGNKNIAKNKIEKNKLNIKKNYSNENTDKNVKLTYEKIEKIKTNYIKNSNNSKIIKEIIKIITNDKNEIEKIINEIETLQIEIEQEKNLVRLKKIEERLKQIEFRIKEILNNYEILKMKLSPDIILKIENYKLTDTISYINTLSNDDLEQIINNYEVKLDYFEHILIANNLKNKAKESIDNRKIVIIEHKDEFDEEKKEIEYIVEESNKLIEQFKLEDKKLKEISTKIDEININKTVVKYNKVDSIFSKTGQFIKGILGLPLVATLNPALIAVGSYLIGSSIKNMRKNMLDNKEDKIYYEPDKTYIEELKINRYKIEDLERMLSNNINDIKYLKREYISNFGNYHDYTNYMKNLNLIEEIERNLILKKQEIIKQKEKINNVENKQQKKLIYIKNLNKE